MENLYVFFNGELITRCMWDRTFKWELNWMTDCHEKYWSSNIFMAAKTNFWGLCYKGYKCVITFIFKNSYNVFNSFTIAILWPHSDYPYFGGWNLDWLLARLLNTLIHLTFCSSTYKNNFVLQQGLDWGFFKVDGLSLSGPHLVFQIWFIGGQSKQV